MRDVQDLYPLTPSQEGLLFDLLVDPDPSAYVVQLVADVEGDLDVDRLAAAFEALAARHDVLRTSFLWEGLDRPLQVVHHEARPTVAQIRVDAASSFEAWLEADRARAFDLTRAPLMRASVRGEGGARQLVWTFHHMILDGWSWGLLWGELGRLYRGERLEPAPRFREYVAWVEARDLTAELEDAATHLAGWTPTPLPGVRTEPTADPRRRGDAVEFSLSEADVERVRAFGREHGATVGTLVQGAWALLLAGASGRDEVTFGVVQSGRPPELAGVDAMAGMFVAATPAQVSLPRERGTLDWLAEVQRASGHRAAWATVPLAEVQRAAGLRAGEALFRTVVVVQNYPLDPHALDLSPKVAVRRVSSREWNRYPLTLIVDAAAGMQGRLRYDAALFDPPVVAELASRFRALLVGLTAGEVRVGALLPTPARAEPTASPASPAPAAPAPARPRRSTEQALIEIWEQVLGCSSVDAGDDFFELGGHSILAMRMVARVRARFGVELPLRSVFDVPTLAGLAAEIEARADKGEAS